MQVSFLAFFWFFLCIHNMKILSPAFQHMQMIPSFYTCEGKDISPPFLISEAPSGAKSLAFVMDDPDAPMGTWVHWVFWNLPMSTTEIAENVTLSAPQGRTDFGFSHYGGPCPPSGIHRYFFKLYALDTVLDLPAGSTKSDLEKAMIGHVLEKAELVGLYKKVG